MAQDGKVIDFGKAAGLRYRSFVPHPYGFHDDKRLAKIADSSLSLIIRGETGTGKTVLAESIHAASGRRYGNFITVNISALSESLVESELFGHKKGAFTGADKNHIGRLVEADGGTLFLDEIGELSPTIQIKLLTFLQSGEVIPVGGNEKDKKKVDVRVIAATNADPEKTLRRDLYYRLKGFEIVQPPLRDNPDEIPNLARRFIQDMARKEGRDPVGISEEADAALRGYSWPGNIRELENTIHTALVLCEGDEITLRDLPARLLSLLVARTKNKTPDAGGAFKGSSSKKSMSSLASIRFHAREKFENLVSEYEGLSGQASGDELTQAQITLLKDNICKQVEKHDMAFIDIKGNASFLSDHEKAREILGDDICDDIQYNAERNMSEIRLEKTRERLENLDPSSMTVNAKRVRRTQLKAQFEKCAERLETVEQSQTEKSQARARDLIEEITLIMKHHDFLFPSQSKRNVYLSDHEWARVRFGDEFCDGIKNEVIKKNILSQVRDLKPPGR